MLSQSSKYKGCLRGEVCRPVKTFFVISFFHTKPHIGSGDFMDINKNNNNIVPCVMLFHNFSFRLNRYTRYKKGISLLRNVLNEQKIFDRLQQKSCDKLQALHFPVPAGWRHGVAKSNLVSIEMKGRSLFYLCSMDINRVMDCSQAVKVWLGCVKNNCKTQTFLNHHCQMTNVFPSAQSGQIGKKNELYLFLFAYI